MSTALPNTPGDLEQVLRRAIEREKRARAVAENLVEERTEALRLAYLDLHKKEEQRFVETLNLMPIAVLLVNQREKILLANPTANRLYSDDENSSLVGRQLYDVLLGFDQKLSSQGLLDVAAILRRTNNETINVEIASKFASFHDTECHILILRDQTEQKRYQEALHHQATHDALTNLPNRLLLLDRMEQAIASCRRRNTLLAVYFIDLDKFKTINDTMGHDAGDQVLCAVADRLFACIRTEDTVARLGGDEFVVTCEVPDEGLRDLLGQRILNALLTPVKIGLLEQIMGGSVGIAQFPTNGQEAERLLKCADIAMYHAKANGGGFVQCFSQDMQKDIDERLLLEMRLRYAIFNHELILHYQPQVDLHTGMLIGFEALVRWNSPDYGLVPPNRFIPIAEETQLIKDLGRWVLNAACAQIKSWQEQGFGWLTVAVNLSATEFCGGETVANIKNALTLHQVPPACLELELTESLSLNDPEASILIMQEINLLGVRLSIDDFGIGYSNLSYLRRFPADCLKIDQSFTRGLSSNQEDRAIVRTVIQLAHSLSLISLAEGVETKNDAQILHSLGADRIQGYWIARPLPPADLVSMLNQPKIFDPNSLLAQGEKARVLIVDDCDTMRMVLYECLSDSLPLEIDLVANGVEADTALLANVYTVVISDYILPGENGVSILAKAKKLLPRACRILITGSPDAQILRDAINQAGVEHFLSKPIDMHQLVETVRTACYRNLHKGNGN